MHQHAAELLQTSLELAHAPVAIAIADAVPVGVSAFDGAVAAGCSFWELAAKATFSTSVEDHALCSIGVHTHNLAGAPVTQARELGTTLAVLRDLDYVREDEVAAIPVLARSARHAIYGPLATAPIAPDVVVLFAHSRTSLVITEGVQRVDGGVPPAMGRPACAMIPQAINEQRAAMSLGCCGARAYLDALTDDIALWALPGAKIERYAEQIAKLATANATLGRFHMLRRQSVARGEQPTVEQSLAALGAS